MTTRTVRNGATITVPVETGETLKVIAVTGTYTATIVRGTGIGTALATAASGGSYGPYAYQIVVSIASSASSEIDFDVAVTPDVATDTVANYSFDTSGNVTGLVGPGGSVVRIGDSYRKGRLYRGSYGRRIASWGAALQNSAGTAALVTGDVPPYADGATQVLQLTQNATPSFGQQNPIDNQSFIPASAATSTAGIWVKNPGTRTLSFEFKVFNAAANRNISWYGACDPGDWRFLTLSPSMTSNNSWTYGTDAISYVRCTQVDTIGDAWQAGDVLKFGPAYFECFSRPRFSIYFDDGVTSVINPISAPLISTGKAVTSSSANVFTTAAAHQVVIGMPIKFTDTAPTSLALNTVYWVATVPANNTFTLATDATLATPVTSTGFSGTANYQYAGTQARSCKQIVEQYGFVGSLYIIGGKIGTSGYLTSAEILQMYNAGWSIGSHTYSHPQNNENAGLMLLGPYGYYLSQLNTQGIAGPASLTPANRRVTSTSGSTLTTEAAHQFLADMPIVFTDVAPGSLSLNTVYYVQSPSGTTFSVATSVGGSAITVGAWSGTSNYRYSGSAPDDTAIYADVVAGAAAVNACGVKTATKFMSLPQGGWDPYVRSAIIRAGFKHVRGISTSSNAHTIAVGYPTGSGLSNSQYRSGGWIAQHDSVQTDGTVTATQIQTYIADCITQGAWGGNYHHALTVGNISQLESMLSYLRTKVDAGLIDVVTLDDMAISFGY